MTREQAIARLNECKILEDTDTEIAHVDADDVLTDLLVSLGYKDVVDLYNDITKWYA